MSVCWTFSTAGVRATGVRLRAPACRIPAGASSSCSGPALWWCSCVSYTFLSPPFTTWGTRTLGQLSSRTSSRDRPSTGNWRSRGAPPRTAEPRPTPPVTARSCRSARRSRRTWVSVINHLYQQILHIKLIYEGSLTLKTGEMVLKIQLNIFTILNGTSVITFIGYLENIDIW